MTETVLQKVEREKREELLKKQSANSQKNKDELNFYKNVESIKSDVQSLLIITVIIFALSICAIFFSIIPVINAT